MKKRTSSFLDALTVILKWRKNVIATLLLVVMISIILSVMAAVQYTATTTVLPPSSQQEGFLGLMGASIAGNLGGFSGLSSMLPGTSTTSDLFAAILESGTIRGRVIQMLDLKKVFKTKTNYDTQKMLAEITTIRVSPEGIISVSVTWVDRKLAADIANTYVSELDKFNTETAMTTGKKYRMFIEERLTATIDTLMHAENAFKAFQEKYHTIALDVEIEKAIATIADIRSQIILLEVKKGVIASASQYNNPQLYKINKELRELKKQLESIEMGGAQLDTTAFGVGFSIPFAQLPEISLKYLRLYRDVKVQETVYELLTQQYEQAKIMEAKDTPTVQVLDKASPPERKSIPKRKQITILATFFGIISGICVAFFMEWYEHLKGQQQNYLKLMNIKKQLQSDVQRILTYTKKTFRSKKKQ